MNTLVLRGDLSGEPSFIEFLGRSRKTALDAYAHQELPFERLVEDLEPVREVGCNPLFQVTFALQNTPAQVLRLRGLEVERVHLDEQLAKFDLSLFLVESNGQLEGSITYATDLFDAVFISGMARHYQTLLASVSRAADAPVWQLPILTTDERDRLLVDWNGTQVDYPRDMLLHRLFESQAQRTPDAIAVQCPLQTLSYRELDGQANRLAHYLKTLGVGRETLVGICMERTASMVVAMLAILKACGAYVPLDPDYPADRLRFMLDDTRVRVVLTQSRSKAKVAKAVNHVLSLDEDTDLWKGCPDTDLPSGGASDDLAYVMYTSGSTGTPKGVMVPHRGITRLVCNADYVQLGATDRVAQISNVSFDAATFEIWGALVNGARITILPRDVALDLGRLADVLRSSDISTVFLTTALFNEVVRACPSALAGLKQVLFGGEAVDPWSVDACLRAGGPQRLLHVYGPTETTTFATWHHVREVAPGRRTIPIGRPIANTTAYVLDRHGQQVPVGTAGELYIGGDGVARGYWSRPELTAERFVPDRFGGRPGAQLYRTGDRVRHLPDGSIEFLGRLDRQIKLRGFRIEPGEIEAVLAEQPDVRQAVVLLREDQPGDPRLVAYVVPRVEPMPQANLRAELRRRLPDYMIPAAFVHLTAMPLTANGKIDRAALPAPSPERIDCPALAPESRDNIERHLVRIWEVLLQRESVGLRDDFFDLGGSREEFGQADRYRYVAAAQRQLHCRVSYDSHHCNPFPKSRRASSRPSSKKSL